MLSLFSSILGKYSMYGGHGMELRREFWLTCLLSCAKMMMPYVPFWLIWDNLSNFGHLVNWCILWQNCPAEIKIKVLYTLTIHFSSLFIVQHSSPFIGILLVSYRRSFWDDWNLPLITACYLTNQQLQFLIDSLKTYINVLLLNYTRTLTAGFSFLMWCYINMQMFIEHS